jgi:hypothetical protein
MIEDREARGLADVPLGLDRERFEPLVVVVRAQHVAGPEELGGLAADQRQLAQDEAVEDQQSYTGLAKLTRVRRLPQPALGTLDACEDVPARKRQRVGGEILAEFRVDLEDRHDVASFSQHRSPVLPAVKGL